MSFLERLLRGKPPATPEEADRITLRKLQGYGADLTKPRHVLHFLELSSGSLAEAVAEELERAGYEATVVRPTDPNHTGWTVRAEGNRIVDQTTVPAMRAWFEALAARHNGEYEGWEVSRTP
jgi:hypothetical protein